MSESAGAPAAATSAPVTQTTGNTTGSKGTEPASRPQSDASASTQTQSKPAPAKPETFEVKIDGKVVKMTRDEILQNASLGHAADKRFKEAAKMRKEAETTLGKMRNPKEMMSALQDPALGLSREQIREAFEEWYTTEFIEPESLSPEQKKLRDAEAKLKKYETDEKTREDQKLKEQQESMTSQAREQLQGQIIEALETSGLPKTNFTIRRLAYWMNRNNANGFDAPMEVVVGQVRNEMNASLRELVEASDGEVMIKLLGDNIIQKLRKYDLEQLRKMRGQPAAESQAQESHSPGTARNEAKRVTSADVNQRLRQLQKTGRY